MELPLLSERMSTPYVTSFSLEPLGTGESPLAYQTMVLLLVLVNQMARRKREVSVGRGRKPKAKSPEGESHAVLLPVVVRLLPKLMF